jgi:hypothetical protein
LETCFQEIENGEPNISYRVSVFPVGSFIVPGGSAGNEDPNTYDLNTYTPFKGRNFGVLTTIIRNLFGKSSETKPKNYCFSAEGIVCHKKKARPERTGFLSY